MMIHFPPIRIGSRVRPRKLTCNNKTFERSRYQLPDNGGKFLEVSHDEVKKENTPFPDWPLLEKRLRQLHKDMTIADFLDQYFKEEKHAILKNSVKGFAEGYDAADTTRASVFGFRDEWLNDDDGRAVQDQGRLRSTDEFSADECTLRPRIHLSSVVKEIHWKKDHVLIITTSGEISKQTRW
jgi:monoamine oxidase